MEVQRTIGFAAGAACAVALGLFAAGNTPTRMVGIAEDRPESPAWQSPEPEPATEYYGESYASSWLSPAADTSSSRFRDETDDYTGAGMVYAYPDPVYDPEQDVMTDASFVLPGSEDSADLVAASAEQAAQDVQEALASPATASASATERPAALPAATTTPTAATRQLAGAQR
ncbi:hypothetical protein L284_08915 [Novosphingobium lindaniclasticum LE124]|uniref:Uncharacterized protein n=1 Tax=Novosphingobium lindaniclasticum LE124 TaxID=1096930 RepID=T0IYF4_9SPHN|nr:hypothetical protein L284_08915 [Novosphingobium lindaniclasticum LE124]